ncbi:hypothetical protein KQX54_010179 [Cotesia glomerata]|uniref:Uncharacterized protein n=1 Tax=Cotesia glomerata TaxID=32391 RepID=A0AAV7I2A0_COTGL|nr:hypothetical protein KQX54_010179 [Cotesia glomerata]
MTCAWRRGQRLAISAFSQAGDIGVQLRGRKPSSVRYPDEPCTTKFTSGMGCTASSCQGPGYGRQCRADKDYRTDYECGQNKELKCGHLLRVNIRHSTQAHRTFNVFR